MAKILIIEDNEDLAMGLSNNLELEDHEIHLAALGADGLKYLASHPVDLVVLDLMLPDLDGYRVLKEIREEHGNVPVLILSARAEELDKVRGFRLGADDYVTKPFGVMELLARVEALLRRAEGGGAVNTEAPLSFGDVEVDPRTRLVRRSGHLVSLAPKEFDLLLSLMRRNGAACSRKEILEEVWGYGGRLMTRTVDTHVAQLRRKLEEDPARPRYIKTVRKIGYRFEW